MKNILFLVSILLFTTSVIWAQKGDEDAIMYNQAKARDKKVIDEAVNSWWTASMKTVDQRTAWWKEARFGMFVHWGIYSLPGGEWKGKPVNGYAEHIMRSQKIIRKEYLELAHQFNPSDFYADEWITAAKNAGMRYFVITAKHHDGFAMYDSKVSDFNILQQTPFKRDPMAELSAACKKNGIKFGFYYSHAFDWEHPDAPGNDWEYDNPGGDLLLHGGKNWFDVQPERLPKAVKYVDEKAIPQIVELLTKYHPDLLWFDTAHKLPFSENLRILQAIRATDPNVVVNGRLASTANTQFGDYKNTADRPAEFLSVTGNWEGVPTTNESYGYHKLDNSHKSPDFFVRLLAKSASKGGNELMNVGPMGNGKMDQKDLDILSGIGKWMTINGESIYGTDRSPLAIQNWGVCTQKENKLYLHVFNWPKNGKLIVGGLKSDVERVWLLADPAKKSLAVKRINPFDLSISISAQAPDTVNTVIVLETKNAIVADPTRLLSTISPNRLLVFDAKIQGKGLTFGDGKTNRYYVQNWNKNEQKIVWTLRLESSCTYKITLKYIGTKESEGTFRLSADGNTLTESQINSQPKDGEAITLDLGNFSLDKGNHDILIEPLKISKTELMRLMEITLTPE